MQRKTMNCKNNSREEKAGNPVDSPDSCIEYYEDIDEDDCEDDVSYEEECDDD